MMIWKCIYFPQWLRIQSIPNKNSGGGVCYSFSAWLKCCQCVTPKPTHRLFERCFFPFSIFSGRNGIIFLNSCNILPPDHSSGRILKGVFILPRLSQFAPKNGYFWTFVVWEPLILLKSISKTACSADLPYWRRQVELRKWVHVFTSENTDERREDTPLLECCGEPPGQRRTGGTATSTLFGRTQWQPTCGVDSDDRDVFGEKRRRQNNWHYFLMTVKNCRQWRVRPYGYSWTK